MRGLTGIFQLRPRREDRFIALVRPHINLMYRMAYRWTQNREEAEDLVQDVLTRLVSKTEELARVEKLSPWLIKVLYRQYVDLYRRHSRSPIEYEANWCADGELYDNHVSAHMGDIEQLELQRTLNNALASLSNEQRDTVLLYDVEGYSLIEVAEVMEVSVGTVKSRLHRSRKTLRGILQEGTFEDELRVKRQGR